MTPCGGTIHKMESVESTTEQSSVKDSFPDLDERLWRIESTLDIQRLEARYSQTWDASDHDGWADVFTEDGIFHCVDLVGRPGFRHRGREQLAAFCKDLQTGMERLHLINSNDVEVDGDTAHGRTTFECHRVELGSHPAIGLVTGYYETDFVVTEAGWKIKQRVEHLVFVREERYYEEATAQ
jgi:uncharacterized protein (TIGR02246 family)